MLCVKGKEKQVEVGLNINYERARQFRPKLAYPSHANLGFFLGPNNSSI